MPNYPPYHLHSLLRYHIIMEENGAFMNLFAIHVYSSVISGLLGAMVPLTFRQIVLFLVMCKAKKMTTHAMRGGIPSQTVHSQVLCADRVLDAEKIIIQLLTVIYSA